MLSGRYPSLSRKNISNWSWNLTLLESKGISFISSYLWLQSLSPSCFFSLSILTYFFSLSGSLTSFCSRSSGASSLNFLMWKIFWDFFLLKGTRSQISSGWKSRAIESGISPYCKRSCTFFLETVLKRKFSFATSERPLSLLPLIETSSGFYLRSWKNFSDSTPLKSSSTTYLTPFFLSAIRALSWSSVYTPSLSFRNKSLSAFRI